MDGVVTMTPKTYKEFLNVTPCHISNPASVLKVSSNETTNLTVCPNSKSASILGESVKGIIDVASCDVSKLDSESESGDNDMVDYTQYRTQMVIHLGDGIDIAIPNRGVKVFPVRAVLRIGMLLTQSTVAKEVRTHLLNVYEIAKEDKPEIVTQELDREQSLYIEFTQKLIDGDTNGMLIAFQNIVDYHNRHTIELEKKIDKIETANQVLTTDLMKISDRSSLSRTIRCLSSKTHKAYSAIWNEFYTFLAYKEHIELKKRGGKPYVNHIRDDEWQSVQKALIGYIEKNGINATDFIDECEIVK